LHVCCIGHHSSDLSVDAMDVSGEQHIDVEHNVYKQRLNATGQVIPTEPEKESSFLLFAFTFLIVFF